MKFKILWLSILLFNGSFVFATTKTRKVAQQGGGVMHEIVLEYGSTTRNFRDIKVMIAPAAAYLSFTSYGDQEYILDCPRTNGSYRWECFSPCGGGAIKISFSQETGFKDLTMEPFKIRPRLCDGSEDGDDPYLNSGKSLRLSLQKAL